MKLLQILADILNFSNDLMSNPAFRLRSVFSESSFTRARKLSFSDLIRALLYSGKESMQAKISHFLDRTHGDGMSYSKQAFSKRRHLVRPEALLEFVNLSVDTFYREAAFHTFHGYLTAAIDGSRYNLPCTPQLAELYGTQLSNGEEQVQALGSCLYDVLNGLILDCVFDHSHANERVLAEKHLDAFEHIPYDKFLVLFDRGYPSYDMIKALQERNLHYVMRCSYQFVRTFLKAAPDCLITHTFHANEKDPLTFRLLTVPVGDGSVEYLITDLMDASLTLEDFKRLYHMRWGIETEYDTLKNKLQIENFSGISDVAIRQDYYATIYLSNLAAVIAFELKDEVQKARKQGNKLQYKANMNMVLSELRANVLELVLTESAVIRELLLAQIASRLVRAVVPIRPNRHFERKKKHRAAKFSQNSKRP